MYIPCGFLLGIVSEKMGVKFTFFVKPIKIQSGVNLRLFGAPRTPNKWFYGVLAV